MILINNWKIVKNSLENCFRSIWSLKLVVRQDVRRGDEAVWIYSTLWIETYFSFNYKNIRIYHSLHSLIALQKGVIYIISLWRMFSVRIMPFWIRYFFKYQSEKVLNILSTFRYFPLLVVSPDWCNSQIFLNWFIVEYQIVWADFTLYLWTLWCETTKSFGKSV